MASLMEWENCKADEEELAQADYVLTKLESGKIHSHSILSYILQKSLPNYHTIVMKHGSDDLKEKLVEWMLGCDCEWDDDRKRFIEKEEEEDQVQGPE